MRASFVFHLETKHRGKIYGKKYAIKKKKAYKCITLPPIDTIKPSRVAGGPHF